MTKAPRGLGEDNFKMTMTVNNVQSNLQSQISRFVDVHMRPSEDEFILIAYSYECRVYAAALKICLTSRGLEVVCARMAAQSDPGLSERLDHCLPASLPRPRGMSVVTLESENMSHFPVFRNIISRFGEDRVRTFRLTSVGPRLFEEGLAMSYEEMTQRNGTLLAELQRDDSIRIKSEAGTDLEIVFDHERYEWMSIRGMTEPGRFTILPAGEIATYPASIAGVFVGDGAIHPNVIIDFDTRLERSPLVVEIEGSSAISAKCDDANIDLLTRRLFEEPHGRRVGEVGFGTNAALRGFTLENSHLNERFPGLHLGFGRHNQNPDVVGYISDTHCDVIMQGGYVTSRSSGGADISLAEFKTDDGVTHPFCNRDEDLDDCCSVL